MWWLNDPVFIGGSRLGMKVVLLAVFMNWQEHQILDVNLRAQQTALGKGVKSSYVLLN